MDSLSTYIRFLQPLLKTINFRCILKREILYCYYTFILPPLLYNSCFIDVHQWPLCFQSILLTVRTLRIQIVLLLLFHFFLLFFLCLLEPSTSDPLPNVFLFHPPAVLVVSWPFWHEGEAVSGQRDLYGLKMVRDGRRITCLRTKCARPWSGWCRVVS